MASRTMWSAKPLASQSHANQLLVGERSKVVHLLALELVLDALAIRSVANQRENRANAFDQQRTLVGLRIIECSLDRNQTR